MKSITLFRTVKQEITFYEDDFEEDEDEDDDDDYDDAVPVAPKITLKNRD